MTAINVPTMSGPNLGFKARINSSKTITPSSVGFIFDNVVYDTMQGYNATTGIYTIPQTGTYRFDVQVDGSAQTPASAQQINITIDVNTSTVATSRSPSSQSANSLITAQLSTAIPLNVGDQIRIQAFSYPSGNVLVQGINTQDQTYLSIVLLSPGVQGIAGPSGGPIPTGVILPYPNVGAPAGGFLLCDGTTYLNTDYPALAAVLNASPQFVVDATHFKVPDLRGRTMMGYTLSDGNFNPMGWTGGFMLHSHALSGGSADGHAKIYAALTNAAGNFQHSRITVPTWTPNVSNQTVLAFQGGAGTTTAATALGGNTDLTSILPPYQVVQFIIKT